MWKEFKEFAVKGNMVDMAIGIVIGGAFGTIVKSLVSDIIMPVVGYFGSGTDFTNRFITLGGGSYDTLQAAQEAGAATVNYGLFINALIAFLIVAIVLFIVVKAMNSLQRKEEAPDTPVKPAEDILLLRQIRDALQKP
jgi:large conductance mechanosensitive channel